MWIMMLVGGTVGIFASLFLFIGIPAVVIWKIYRKLRYKIALYD